MSKTYKHIGYDDILNISSRSGSPVDRMGNALTLTNVDIEPDGDVLASLFNGVNSIINCGNADELLTDISILTWVKTMGYGEGNVNNSGNIINKNNNLILLCSEANRRYRFTDNGTADAANFATDSLVFNIWQCLAVTRTAAGIANCYVDGVLSGTTDQDAGTPVAGGDILIGNQSAQSRTFDGLIEPVIIKPRILTAAEIQQYYTATRKSYENH